MPHCESAVRRAGKSLIDADLGGGVIKQRIARGSRDRVPDNSWLSRSRTRLPQWIVIHF